MDSNQSENLPESIQEQPVEEFSSSEDDEETESERKDQDNDLMDVHKSETIETGDTLDIDIKNRKEYSNDASSQPAGGFHDSDQPTVTSNSNGQDMLDNANLVYETILNNSTLPQEQSNGSDIHMDDYLEEVTDRGVLDFPMPADVDMLDMSNVGVHIFNQEQDEPMKDVDNNEDNVQNTVLEEPDQAIEQQLIRDSPIDISEEEEVDIKTNEENDENIVHIDESDVQAENSFGDHTETYSLHDEDIDIEEASKSSSIDSTSVSTSDTNQKDEEKQARDSVEVTNVSSKDSKNTTESENLDSDSEEHDADDEGFDNQESDVPESDLHPNTTILKKQEDQNDKYVEHKTISDEEINQTSYFETNENDENQKHTTDKKESRDDNLDSESIDEDNDDSKFQEKKKKGRLNRNPQANVPAFAARRTVVVAYL